MMKYSIYTWDLVRALESASPTQIPSQIGYINSLDFSRFIFREFRMTFFHKIMVAEKYFSNA